MPRGDNPNSRANLKPLSTEEARKRGRAGAKKSAQARANYKSLTEALRAQCTPEVMAQLTDILIKRAKQGNLKAYELVRDQLGEKPMEKVAVSTVNEEAMERLSKAIEQRKQNEQNKQIKPG